MKKVSNQEKALSSRYCKVKCIADVMNRLHLFNRYRSFATQERIEYLSECSKNAKLDYKSEDYMSVCIVTTDSHYYMKIATER